MAIEWCPSQALTTTFFSEAARNGARCRHCKQHSHISTCHPHCRVRFSAPAMSLRCRAVYSCIIQVLLWLSYCQCGQDGTPPFGETLLHAVLGRMLSTWLPRVVDALATRITQALAKTARVRKQCRRIKSRRYKPCRRRRRQSRNRKAWTRLWHWSRKLRNRLDHSLHGNGPLPTCPTAPRDNTEHSPTGAAASTAQAPLNTDTRLKSYSMRERAEMLNKVPMEIPGDGWCLMHAVSWYFERHEGHEPVWSVKKAAETYVQALEWLIAHQFDGPNAADIEIACMLEHPAELQLHRRFLECRGIALPVEMPEGLTVLWSKLTAVMEVPNMLDTIHHGTSVDILALTKAFGFPVLVWSTDGDANYWIASMEQVTETEALRLADQHPQALQVLHQPMGHTGHYSLLLGPRPDTPLWQPTPWLQMWHREGARALQQHLGMFRVQSPRVEPAGQPNLPTASPATAEAASEPGNPTAPNQDPWPAPATPPCSSGSEVGFADTESVVSWNSHQSSEGSSAAPSLALEPERALCTLEDQHFHSSGVGTAP